MDMETRSTDSKGRVSLPKEFANATVIIDQLSETEIRFSEEMATPLSDRDRFLDLLHHPPAANPALKAAAARHTPRHG
jgi:uncharacterized protein (DUF1778 family)